MFFPKKEKDEVGGVILHKSYILENSKVGVDM